MARPSPASPPPVPLGPVLDSLKQVVMALAMNAGAAMGAGGVLSVRAKREGRLILLDVADTGPVVPQARRARVFEPYDDAQRGGGLGLAVARSLLRGRGGDLLYRPHRDGNCYRVILRAATGTP